MISAQALFDLNVEGNSALQEKQSLDALCGRAQTAALEAFSARAVGDVAASVKESLTEELGRRKQTLEASNLAASEKHCGKLLAKLYMNVVWASLTQVAADEDDGATAIDLATQLESSWTVVRLKYAAKSKGPARESQCRNRLRLDELYSKLVSNRTGTVKRPRR